MKTFALSLLILLAAAVSAGAQSKSFNTFREKFSGLDHVYCISTNGFLARLVLSMAEEDEVEAAVKNIHKINFITVPREAFAYEKVTVEGFRYQLTSDSFEELATIRDGSEKIYIYQQSTTRDDNRYAVLIEDNDNVILIEMCGYIDPAVLQKYKVTSYNKTE